MVMIRRNKMSSTLTHLLRECGSCFPLPDETVLHPLGVGGTHPAANVRVAPSSLGQDGGCGARWPKRRDDPSTLTPKPLQKLMEIMHKLSCEDFGLKARHPVAGAGSLTPAYLAQSPVTYMAIRDTEHYTVGIFLLKKDKTIPLHDHPGMIGLVKVLYGTLEVTSFDHRGKESKTTPVKPDESEGGDLIPVIKKSDCKLTSMSPVLLLNPRVGNFHRISAVSGPAAFFDILAPPYNDRTRCCNYYHEVPPLVSPSNSEREDDYRVSWLQSIPQPSEFWCYEEPVGSGLSNPAH